MGGKTEILRLRLPVRLGRARVSTELALVEQLLDHVPEIAFFIKEREGRYAAVNQSLVERCGLRERSQLLGRQVGQIFPRELAEAYAAQDERVMRTREALVDHLELHWYARRKPGWCLTTKLPLPGPQGQVVGLMGISRDLPGPGDRESIPDSLARAVAYLEGNFMEALSPATLARQASLPPVRFARLIKRIYGVTPKQLILQTRLNAAAQQLAETDRPVCDVAQECGFYDHSAFTRAFRSVTELTPTQFRGLRQQIVESG